MPNATSSDGAVTFGTVRFTLMRCFATLRCRSAAARDEARTVAFAMSWANRGAAVSSWPRITLAVASRFTRVERRRVLVTVIAEFI